MSATLPRMTADAFIAWAMKQPKRGRYELEQGRVVVDMAPERAIHALLKAGIWERLKAAIRAAGLPCQAFPDGMAVVVNDSTTYEPDAFVRCGSDVPPDAVRITDPVIVVEVGSPSTVARDAREKLVGYFEIASVRHYLLVLPERKVVIHHQRVENGTITTRIVHDGVVRLDPPGITLEDFWPEGLTE